MKLSRRRFTHLAAGGATLSMISRTAGAQAYPTRPVHMIVPLTAGSAADILARRLAQKGGESWGQTVVVENRPGAGTTLGADVVAKAAPDGHTLLMNSAAFAVSAAVYQKLPYDPLKDFAPVSQVAAAPIVVVVAPSLGVKSIKDLIALAKAQPGQINFGSSGVGSSTHLRRRATQACCRPQRRACTLQGTIPKRFSTPRPGAFSISRRRWCPHCRSSTTGNCSLWG
jgi:tripartite-type tricarboxylate transporter receptor subunit TctC